MVLRPQDEGHRGHATGGIAHNAHREHYGVVRECLAVLHDLLPILGRLLNLACVHVGRPGRINLLTNCWGILQDRDRAAGRLQRGCPLGAGGARSLEWLLAAGANRYNFSTQRVPGSIFSPSRPFPRTVALQQPVVGYVLK